MKPWKVAINAEDSLSRLISRVCEGASRIEFIKLRVYMLSQSTKMDISNFMSLPIVNVTVNNMSDSSINVATTLLWEREVNLGFKDE